MDVPPEILSTVCKSLNKPELMMFRLTCKASDRAAVPLLFNEVFLSTIRGDFQTAHLTIRHFGPYIKTIIFSSVYFPAISWSEFKRRTLKQSHVGSKEPNIDHHLRLGYQNYCRLHTEQKADLETGICMAHLTLALHSLLALERLVLKDIGAFGSGWAHQEHTGGRAFWKGGEACAAPGCDLSAKEHLRYQLRPESGYLNSIANPWDLAMLALWSSESSMKTIATEHKPGSQSLPIWSFNMQRPYLLCDLFRNLTEIRLVIGVGHNDVESHCIRDRHIARTLSVASQLRVLQLSLDLSSFGVGDKVHGPPFEAILGGCQFVKLESCELDHTDSTSKELINFLQAPIKLTRFYLSYHKLTAGTWESTADEMRACLNLEDAKLSDLFGGWKTNLNHHFPEWRYNARAVREFFLRSGRNPFSGAALEDYEDRQQSEANDISMSDTDSSEDDRSDEISSDVDSGDDVSSDVDSSDDDSNEI